MASFRRFRPPFLVTLLAVGTLAVVAVGCGGDDNGSAGEHAGHEGAPGQSSERAFLSAMVPHHRSAIEMAEIAQRRAQAPEMKRLADAIVSAQRTEISQMGRIHERLFGTALQPDEKAHGKLGLSADEAGMAHSNADIEELRSASPFDRAFVDMMIPHHEGAVRMARAVLEDSGDRELRSLAERIVADQQREVREMNSFRERTYGAPVREAGGHDHT